MPKFLLVKTTSLGDVIHNLPVVMDIRRRWPEAEIDWLVESSFADIPRMHPGVRRVIEVSIRAWRRRLFSLDTWHEMSAALGHIRGEKYDFVIDSQGLIKSAILTKLARGVKAGYAAEAAREPVAAWFYDAHYVVPRHVHAVMRNRWLVSAALGYEFDELRCHYGLSVPSESFDWLVDAQTALRNTIAGKDVLPPYVVCLSMTSRASKRWDVSAWQALFQRCHERGVVCVLPAGSESERVLVRSMIAGAGVSNVVLPPPLSLSQCAALLGNAAAVIGVDSGLTHLAVALGRPTIGLYVDSDPVLVGLYASPLLAEQVSNVGDQQRVPTVDEVDALLMRYLSMWSE